jgi:hypothetical protein
MPRVFAQAKTVHTLQTARPLSSTLESHGFYLQLTTETKIATLGASWNAEDMSSARLPTEGVTYSQRCFRRAEVCCLKSSNYPETQVTSVIVRNNIHCEWGDTLQDKNLTPSKCVRVYLTYMCLCKNYKHLCPLAIGIDKDLGQNNLLCVTNYDISWIWSNCTFLFRRLLMVYKALRPPAKHNIFKKITIKWLWRFSSFFYWLFSLFRYVICFSLLNWRRNLAEILL